MTVNFDILISGCNTRCKHCYVNGGPSGRMPMEDALLTFEKLDLLAELLPYETSFTLDNEPMNHPDIETIIRSAASTKHIECYHHGMTSGIALMLREDRRAVMQAYMDCGYRDFGITIHGNSSHHDEIVRREGAYQATVESAEFMKDCGAEVNVSLMFNRFFAEDANEIDALLKRLQPSFIYFAIPNYTPHTHMLDYEPYRATSDTLRMFRPWLMRWGLHEEDFSKEICTVGMLRERLEQGLDLIELFRLPQDEIYMTVHKNGELFVGNTGVETELLGNMRTLNVQETAKNIRVLPGNRDYGAFYEENLLPNRETLIHALEQLPPELLYSDIASVVYRGLTMLGLPTKHVSERSGHMQHE